MADELSLRLERCQRVLAASRDGFWERDLRTGQVWHSPSLVALLGQGALRQPGGLDQGQRHVHPDDLAAYQAALNGALRSHGSFAFELRLRARGGQWRWMRGRGQVWLSDTGEPQYLCGMLSDIDAEKTALLAQADQQRALEALVHERTAGLEAALALAERRRQEAEQANAAKGRFLAHMSHEIRTPLNGVLGLTELALRTPLASDQRRYLESTRSAAESVLHVISDVLDLSRIESGRVALRPRAFDPVRAMAETVRALMPLNRNPELQLLFDWEGDDAWMMGDDSALRQIVTNLLGNALKFTPQGRVTLRGRTRRLADGPVHLWLEVADTGPGIPEDRRAEVFEPFVQGDNSLARGHGGAGLGLAIAQRLAEALGALLQLDCPPTGGSVFSLSLQLPEAPQPDTWPAQAEAPAPGKPGLAWLVYPDADSAEWLATRLARLGWQTHVKCGMTQALVGALSPGQDRPELVLLAASVLRTVDSLQPLRQALPLAAIRLLVLPQWHDPMLEAQATSLNIHPVVAPLTPAQLAVLASADAARLELPGAGLAPRLQAQAEVLLVEDNPVNQLVGQEFLKSLGLQVRLAGDGEAALQACMDRAPHLVLMDLEMPGLDGLQATRRLRELQRQGHWPGAPIVALTAHASAADVAACQDAGMDGVLTKPLSLDTLRKRLAHWLSV